MTHCQPPPKPTRRLLAFSTPSRGILSAAIHDRQRAAPTKLPVVVSILKKGAGTMELLAVKWVIEDRRYSLDWMGGWGAGLEETLRLRLRVTCAGGDPLLRSG